MRASPLHLLTILAFYCAGAASAQIASIAPTEAGRVEGVIEKDLTVFRGIPFATPPVGALRWRAPQPVAPWEGVKSTKVFAADPYQGDGSGQVSEDCLYLNVWTPAKTPADRLPVLVWIYGGGFSFGSTSTPVHNGEHLARKGVVLVTLNYRVGPLGFLAHPALSAESPRHVSGNYGLQDQIAALRWIQKNIASFGGDPAKVTIFGESAGGISVSMLCASPEASGLFRGAISQSGGSFGPSRPTTYPGENMRSLAEAEAAGVEFMRKAGASSLEELRALPPAKLPPGWGSGAAWPIVDGWIIPGDQHNLYSKGQYNDVAVLIGYNSDEGLSFSRERTVAEYEANVRLRYGPFADRLLQAYPPVNGTVGRSTRNLMRDAAFGWHTWSWARLQARTGKAPVYLYHFDRHATRPAGSPEADHGMPHGVDVPYVFQTLDRGTPGLTEEDFSISEIVSNYWVQFAKTANPNREGLEKWPRFSEKEPRVMYFRGEATVGDVPDEGALAVLDAYFEWRRTPEGQSAAK